MRRGAKGATTRHVRLYDARLFVRHAAELGCKSTTYGAFIISYWSQHLMYILVSSKQPFRKLRTRIAYFSAKSITLRFRTKRQEVCECGSASGTRLVHNPTVLGPVHCNKQQATSKAVWDCALALTASVSYVLCDVSMTLSFLWTRRACAAAGILATPVSHDTLTSKNEKLPTVSPLIVNEQSVSCAACIGVPQKRGLRSGALRLPGARLRVLRLRALQHDRVCETTPALRSAGFESQSRDHGKHSRSSTARMAAKRTRRQRYAKSERQTHRQTQALAMRERSEARGRSNLGSSA